MPHLAERTLPIPEVRSLNPVIGKNLIMNIFTVNCQKSRKPRKIGAGNGSFFLKKRMKLDVLEGRHVFHNFRSCVRSIVPSEKPAIR